MACFCEPTCAAGGFIVLLLVRWNFVDRGGSFAVAKSLAASAAIMPKPRAPNCRASRRRVKMFDIGPRSLVASVDRDAQQAINTSWRLGLWRTSAWTPAHSSGRRHRPAMASAADRRPAPNSAISRRMRAPKKLPSRCRACAFVQVRFGVCQDGMIVPWQIGRLEAAKCSARSALGGKRPRRAQSCRGFSMVTWC
jgi:hypothetical protein